MGDDRPGVDCRSQKVCAYLRLFCAWSVSNMCGGVSPGMNLFIPMFAQSGVFADQCGGQSPCQTQYLLISNMFMFCFTLTALGNIPSGILFDVVGGRAVAVIAALIVSMGSLVLVVGLTMSSVTIIIVAMVLMDMGDAMCSASMLGMLWELPESQGLLLGLTGSSDAGSCLLPIFFHATMSSLGVSLRTCFVAYAFVTAAAALALLFIVPSQERFFAKAEAVLGIPVTPDKYTWSSIGMSIRLAFRVTSVQKRDCVLVIIVSLMLSVVNAPWDMQLAQFERLLFGDQNIANEIAVSATKAQTLIQLSCSISAGYFLDYTSLGALSSSLLAVCLLLILAGGARSYWVQMFSCFLSMMIDQLSALLPMKWIAYWAPPHRFGMVNAVITTVQMLGGNVMFVSWSLIIYTFDGLEGFIIALHIFGWLAISFLGLQTYRFIKNPKPGMVLIAKDEEELMEQYFGLKTIADAEYVLQISRGRILALLGSQSLSEKRRLIDLMKDDAVQVRWAKRCYSQGYEIPDLDTVSYLMLVAADFEEQLSSFFCCEQGTASITPRASRRR